MREPFVMGIYGRIKCETVIRRNRMEADTRGVFEKRRRFVRTVQRERFGRAGGSGTSHYADNRRQCKRRKRFVIMG